MTMTTCKKCGSGVSRKEKVCPYCGVKKPGERWWYGVVGLVGIAAILVGLKACPGPSKSDQVVSFNYGDVSLKEWRAKDKEERLKIIDNYLVVNGGMRSATDGFYSCMSQYSFTKNDDVKALQALDWCKQSYDKEPLSLARMVNFDAFKSNVRSFDSSYRPLTAAIKESMNNPSTFEHVETSYRFVLDNTSPYAVVTTVYRGSNSFGALVKNSVSAKVDLRTGNIVEYL
ncbi:hypothetical protein I1A46_01350 [Serratia liquefaciens]|uniref:hypothetical protein n=1 Tax=Serratia liquefaciens TaxID=614 RepID=UPI0018A7AD2E|nr:hypothetical protein [Serratia liquefaciens]MBF8103770.1 hypothetical protein [Serratia liquefaciens]